MTTTATLTESGIRRVENRSRAALRLGAATSGLAVL